KERKDRAPNRIKHLTVMNCRRRQMIGTDVIMLFNCLKRGKSIVGSPPARISAISEHLCRNKPESKRKKLFKSRLPVIDFSIYVRAFGDYLAKQIIELFKIPSLQERHEP